MKRLILLSAVAASLWAADAKFMLTSGWFIQPSGGDPREQDEILPNTPYHPHHSYKATVPSTVMAALVADKVFPDPTFGMNLRVVPGTSYPIGDQLLQHPDAAGQPVPRVLVVSHASSPCPPITQGKRVQLHFDGINFRANVWLNGKQIADVGQDGRRLAPVRVRRDRRIVPGKPNALAVEVFPPTPDDLAITFVDWNPAPPDKDMGLWRDVYLTSQRPGRPALPAGDHEARPARHRQGAPHRHGRGARTRPARR